MAKKARGKAQKKRTNWAHGCVECGWRYESSVIPREVNGRCRHCETGQLRPEWELAYAPRECCWHHTVPMPTRDERTRYALGGPPDQPWFRCSMCCRTYPFARPIKNPGSGSRT